MMVEVDQEVEMKNVGKKRLNRVRLVWGGYVLSSVLVTLEVVGPDWVKPVLPSGFWFLVLMLLFSGLGVGLVWLTLKLGLTGRLRRYLLLAGGSGAIFLLLVILHNLLSALLVWGGSGISEEPVLFLLAVIGCPIALGVGLVGSGLRLLGK